MKRTALLSVALLIAAAWSATAAEEKGYPDISLADLKAAMAAKNVTLLDCNGTDKYTKCHIPGALDFGAIKDNLADSLPKEKDALIVSYCGGPKCGAYKHGADAAKELGYTNIKHFSPGISGWKESCDKCQAPAEQTGKAGGCCGG